MENHSNRAKRHSNLSNGVSSFGNNGFAETGLFEPVTKLHSKGEEHRGPTPVGVASSLVGNRNSATSDTPSSIRANLFGFRLRGRLFTLVFGYILTILGLIDALLTLALISMFLLNNLITTLVISTGITVLLIVVTIMSGQMLLRAESSHRTTCMYVTAFVLTIIGALASAFLATSITIHSFDSPHDWNNANPHTLNTLMACLVLAILNFTVAMLAIFISCHGACCQHSREYEQV